MELIELSILTVVPWIHHTTLSWVSLPASFTLEKSEAQEKSSNLSSFAQNNKKAKTSLSYVCLQTLRGVWCVTNSDVNTGQDWEGTKEFKLIITPWTFLSLLRRQMKPKLGSGFVLVSFLWHVRTLSCSCPPTRSPLESKHHAKFWQETFEVDVEIAKPSVTTKTLLEGLRMGGEGDDDPVPLPNVNAAILKRVIQWCAHHRGDTPPPEEGQRKIEQMTFLFRTKNSWKLAKLNPFWTYSGSKLPRRQRFAWCSMQDCCQQDQGETPQETHMTSNIKNDYSRGGGSDGQGERISGMKRSEMLWPCDTRRIVQNTSGTALFITNIRQMLPCVSCIA